MAVTDILGIWQLAATLMGERASSVVKSASVITLPLEATFNSMYDQVRVTALRAGKWDFARRHQVLIEAPILDWQEVSHTWDPNWKYHYALPFDSISFSHFVQDVPEAGIVHSYVERWLPIKYRRLNALVIGGGGEVSSSGSENQVPDYLWRDFTFIDLADESLVKHRIIEKPVTPAGSTIYNLVDELTELILSPSTLTYLGPTSWSIELNVADAAGVYDFAGSNWPTLSMFVAYGRPEARDLPNNPWGPHIFTNLPQAEGVFIVDMVNPDHWPEEFQMVVAGELALQAAQVHAKSSKVITRLIDGNARRQSIAVSNLTSDDGFIQGGFVSETEKARM